MTTTKVKNGQLITSTTTEQDLQPEQGGILLVQCEVVSGTIKFGVGLAGNLGGSPVIDGDTTYGSYTTSNSKSLRTLEVGKFNLRCVGSGTFIVSW